MYDLWRCGCGDGGSFRDHLGRGKEVMYHPKQGDRDYGRKSAKKVKYPLTTPINTV